MDTITNLMSGFEASQSAIRSQRSMCKNIELYKLSCDNLDHSPEHVWENLSLKERSKLRAAYFFKCMTIAVTNDLKKTPYNLIFIGTCLLIPGPSGVFIIPIIIPSYLFRWDDNTKKLRERISGLIRNDVKIEKYMSVTRPSLSVKDKFVIDSSLLLKLKCKSMEKSFHTIKDSVVDLFYKFKKNKKIETKTSEEDIISTLKDKLGKLGDNFVYEIGSIFSAAADLDYNLSEKIAYGVEYNKTEIKNRVNPAPKPQ